MAPHLNDGMDDGVSDYGHQSSPASSASSLSSHDQDHGSGSDMVDDGVEEPMPPQLPNWGFMQCIMQHIYIESGLFSSVFKTLITLGWADHERYPTPLEFITRRNDVAGIETMHSLLKDAVWNTMVQPWVITDHLSGVHTYSSQPDETIRSLIKYRIEVTLKRPIKLESTGLLPQANPLFMS